MDIVLFCHRKNMELVYTGSQVAKPKATFSLECIITGVSMAEESVFSRWTCLKHIKVG